MHPLSAEMYPARSYEIYILDSPVQNDSKGWFYNLNDNTKFEVKVSYLFEVNRSGDTVKIVDDGTKLAGFDLMKVLPKVY